MDQWEAPDDEVCTDAFRHWDRLEEIKLTFVDKGFPMELDALSGVSLRQLTNLEIQVKTRYDANGIPDSTKYSLDKALTQCIQNALQLTQSI